MRYTDHSLSEQIGLHKLAISVRKKLHDTDMSAICLDMDGLKQKSNALVLYFCLPTA